MKLVFALPFLVLTMYLVSQRQPGHFVIGHDAKVKYVLETSSSETINKLQEAIEAEL